MSTELEAIRARKQLTLVSPAQEGEPIGMLPDNVYGFTYSPLSQSTPLFAKHTKQSFEVHKMLQGDVHLIGYVTTAEAEKFLIGREAMEIHLYPEPHAESTAMIELPLDRLVKAKPLSRADGNYMPVSIDPAI